MRERNVPGPAGRRQFSLHAAAPTPEPPAAHEESFFDAVGGHEVFARIVAEFYRRVRDDDVLRPLYPDEDLAGAQQRLLLFLEQYWGGPRQYSQERGHPRLRIRHAPFPITDVVASRWLTLMRGALDTVDLPREQDERLWAYFQQAAAFLTNSR